ncbi:MAG: hypothetical protein FJ135_08310 [Deltaproteobacteria bacterium]|nr:hypothetical protein [Deltaproteobacteria bacterium]
MSAPEWLPPLFKFKGDFAAYLEAIYELFKADFVDTKPTFRGRTLRLKRHPMSEGKEATFWHFIQEGPVEPDRLPDLKRCERIRWPRPIIDNSEDASLKVWPNTRKGETRILLWLEEEEYLVVLAERKGYLLPWTAYMVDKPHRKRKLLKEFEDWKKGGPK